MLALFFHICHCCWNPTYCVGNIFSKIKLILGIISVFYERQHNTMTFKNNQGDGELVLWYVVWWEWMHEGDVCIRNTTEYCVCWVWYFMSFTCGVEESHERFYYWLCAGTVPPPLTDQRLHFILSTGRIVFQLFRYILFSIFWHLQTFFLLFSLSSSNKNKKLSNIMSTNIKYTHTITRKSTLLI